MKINIGKLLKAIAISALSGAVGSAMSTADTEVPGSKKLIEGIGKLLDHEDDNNREGLDAIKSGIVDAMAAIKPANVDNVIEFAAALEDISRAFDRARDALKS